MTQPEPAQTRHTVDTITAPQLTRLYDRLDYLTGYTATLETYAIEQRERADQAEAKLDAVRAECDALEAELYPVADDGMAIAVRRIRTALAAHTTPKEST